MKHENELLETAERFTGTASRILERENAEWEIYVEKGRNGSFEIENEKLEKAQRRFYSGVGIRVATGGHVGFSYIAGLSHRESKIEEMIKRAFTLAKIGEVQFYGFSGDNQRRRVEGLYDRMIDKIPFEDAYGLAKDLAEYMRKEKPGTEYKISGELSLTVKSVGILNSNGVEKSETRTLMEASTYTVKKNGRVGNGYSFQSSRKMMNYEELTELIRKSTEEANKNYRAGTIDGYRGEVALHPLAFSSILSIFMPNLTGDFVYHGRSRISRIGEDVGSELLNIRDDATINGWPGSYSFDGEGTTSQRTELIKNGIVKAFLLNEKYGKILGMKSTGNAIRGFRSTPKIGTSNVIVEPGRDSCKDLDIPLVIEVFGEHTSNPASGDFSLTIGLGEFRGKSFKDNMLTGNVFELLKNISTVGKKTERFGSFSSPIIVSEARIV